MALKTAAAISFRLLQGHGMGIVAPVSNNVNLQFVRYRRTKHWNPKWKRLRRLKVMKVDLPKHEDPEDLTDEEVRSRLKEQGFLPPRPWTEKPYFISSTGGIFEPYVPPEGDGKISPIHIQGAKQKLEFLEKKSKTMMAVRKIRSYEDEWDTKEFCNHAEDIYKKLHECLAKKDLESLTNYATERAYPELINNIERKTIHWKFIENIELPRVVHARCTDVITKENIFGQVTVRFHTKQALAIYDRFGRLMYGSEIIGKDVLEYVVFEKHLANEYGVWRVHSKIIPDWLPPKDPSALTYRKIKPPQVVEKAPVETSADKTEKTPPALPVAESQSKTEKLEP